MNKIMVDMSDEMVKALDFERKARKLESIPETVRAVLGEYFKTKTQGANSSTQSFRLISYSYLTLG
jgi:hypothetical protein